MFVPAPNVIEVVMWYDQFGSKVANVFNVLSGAGVAVADLDRVVGKLRAWRTASLRPQQSVGAVLSLVTATDLTTESGIAKEYLVSPLEPGTGAGAGMPGNVTVAVKWSTAFRGRSFRGRTYHIGILSSAVNGNSITVGVANTYTTVYNALLTQLAGGGTVDQLVVVSRREDKAWRTTAAITPITGASVDINIDSQRRRLTGRGV